MIWRSSTVPQANLVYKLCEILSVCEWSVLTCGLWQVCKYNCSHCKLWSELSFLTTPGLSSRKTSYVSVLSQQERKLWPPQDLRPAGLEDKDSIDRAELPEQNGGSGPVFPPVGFILGSTRITSGITIPVHQVLPSGKRHPSDTRSHQAQNLTLGCGNEGWLHKVRTQSPHFISHPSQKLFVSTDNFLQVSSHFLFASFCRSLWWTFLKVKIRLDLKEPLITCCLVMVEALHAKIWYFFVAYISARKHMLNSRCCDKNTQGVSSNRLHGDVFLL